MKKKVSYVPLKNTLINGMGTFISRITGVIKFNVVNYLFGAGSDTFHSANGNILALRKVLGEGTLVTTFLPVYSKTTDKEHSDRFASNILNQIIILSIIISVIGALLTPLWTRIFLPGFNSSPELFNEIVMLTIIMIFSTVFFSAFSIIMGILNTHERFFTSATAPILSNIVFIVFPLLTYKTLGIMSLAWAIVIGAFLQFLFELIELPFIKFKYHFIIDFKDPFVKNFWKLFFPTAGNYITQAGINIGLGYFASFLPRGSITYLRNANTIIIAPVGFIGAALAGAIFPIFAKIREDRSKLAIAWNQGFLFFLFSSIPIAGFFYFYNDVIVNLIFRDISMLVSGSTGKFTLELQELTANTLKILSTILIPWSLNIIVSRFLYALEFPKLCLILIIINFITNIFGYQISQQFNFGAKGLIYSDLIAGWFTGMLGLLFVYQKLPKKSLNFGVLKQTLLYIVITIISWGSLLPLYNYYISVSSPILLLILGSVIFILGLVLFVGLTMVFKICPFIKKYAIIE